MLFCFLLSQFSAYSDTQTPHAHTVPEIKIKIEIEIEAVLNVSCKEGERAIHMCFVLINSVLLNLLGYVFGSCFRTLAVSVSVSLSLSLSLSLFIFIFYEE